MEYIGPISGSNALQPAHSKLCFVVTFMVLSLSSVIIFTLLLFYEKYILGIFSTELKTIYVFLSFLLFGHHHHHHHIIWICYGAWELYNRVPGWRVGNSYSAIPLL